MLPQLLAYRPAGIEVRKASIGISNPQKDEGDAEDGNTALITHTVKVRILGQAMNGYVPCLLVHANQGQVE